MSLKFRYAFFDFDGVIVDSEPIRLNTYKKLFEIIYGINVEIDNNIFVGRSEKDNLYNLLNLHDLDSDEETINKLRKIRSAMLIKEKNKSFPVITNTCIIIEELKSKRIPMTIVSNSSRRYIITALKSIGMNVNYFHIITI